VPIIRTSVIYNSAGTDIAHLCFKTAVFGLLGKLGVLALALIIASLNRWGWPATSDSSGHAVKAKNAHTEGSSHAMRTKYHTLMVIPRHQHCSSSAAWGQPLQDHNCAQ